MEKINPKNTAAGTAYTPATPGDWSPPPGTVNEALDQLASQAQGEVTSVTASSPLASSGGPTPNITIAAASGSSAGSMSAADKTKLDNLAASTVPYSPGAPVNWNPVPANVGAALDQLAARPQGGGGATNVFVWRENAVNPVAPVYGTFSEAYAAAQATGIPCTIIVDSSLATNQTAYTGTGSFDFSNITFVGAVVGGGSQVVFGDINQNPASVTGLRRVKDLTLYSQSNTTPVISFTNGAFDTWIFDGVNFNSQGQTPFITIDGQTQLTIVCFRATSFSGNPCITVTNQGGLQIALYEQSNFSNDALSDDGTSYVEIDLDLSSQFGTQSQYSGQLTNNCLDILPQGVFVWRPNQRGPYIYPTFSDAWTAAHNSGRPAVIVCSNGGTILPGQGSYDLTDIVVRGERSNAQDSLFISDGVTFFSSNNTLSFENLAINPGMSTTPAWAPSNGSLYLTDVLFYGVGIAPFLSCANGGAVVYVQDSIIGGNPGNEPFATDGRPLVMDISGSSQLQNNSVRGADGFYLTTNAESAITLPQSGFTGSLFLTRSDKANLSAYAPVVAGNWNPAPDNVQDALDQLAARNAPSADASTTTYTPAVGANWNPVPSLVGPALDQLAAANATQRNVFIYAPASVPHANYYATWTDAYNAAFAAAQAGFDAVIGIDDSGGTPCTVDAGNWDLTQITLRGGYGNNLPNTLSIPPGASFGSTIKRIENHLTVDCTTPYPNQVMTASGTNISITLDNNATLSSSGGAVLWNLSGGGVTLSVFLGDNCSIPSPQSFYQGQSTINFYMRGNPCSIGSGIILAGYGSAGLNFYVENPGAVLPDSLGTYSGTAPTYNFLGLNAVHGYASAQTTNLGVGDHVMFDSTHFTSGAAITLDTSSAYSSSLGTPSIGRIALKPGTYKLVANLVDVSGSGNIYVSWRDSQTGSQLGSGSRYDDMTNSDFASRSDAVAFLTVTSPMNVEVGIAFNNGITQIGMNAAVPLYAWFTAERIG